MDMHFTYVSLFAMTPPQRNTQMWLNQAYLDFQPQNNGAYEEETKEYNKDVYQEIVDRTVEVKKAMNKVPRKEVRGLIKMEKMINRRSDLTHKFMQDFHSGLHQVQEYLIHGARDAENKDHISVGSMERIKDQLEGLKLRQQRIYNKFMKVHNVVDKQRSLRDLGNRFKLMRGKLDSLVKSIDEDSLDRLVTNANHVMTLFESIQDSETVWNALEIAKKIGDRKSQGAGFYYSMSAAASVSVAVVVGLIVYNLHQSQQTYNL